MAISKNWHGATIYKSGAYSYSSTDNSGGAAVGSTGVLFLVGEADSGQPGSSAGIVSYSSAQMADLIANYTSGPLVDCARAAANPSKTPGIQGFSKVLIWKTNASMQAALNLQNSTPTAIIDLKAIKYGLAGNYYTVAVSNGTDSTKQRILTVVDTKNNVTQTLNQNAATAQLSIQYIGAGTACTATISGSSLSNMTLATTVTGETGQNLSLTLASYTMVDLVNAIKNFGGGGIYNATLLNTQSGSVTPATDLDPIASTDIKTAAVSLYRLQQEIVDIINGSNLVSATKVVGVSGLPVTLAATFMTGGAKGASANSDFSNGLAQSLSEDYGVVVMCVSQDATADITAGLTDSGSAYTIASVLAAMDSHLQLRGQIKNRKEAQGVGGMRSSTKAAVYTQAETINSALSQLCMQDVLVLDTSGSLVWKYPHVMAAMVAGMRVGVDIGEPLTHKYLNVSGMGHYVDSTTGISAGDFNPQVDYDPAIQAGVLFAEKNQGAWRIVVDNTTYGVDGSFYANRGSVVQAAQYAAQQLRATAELVFVGQKVSNGMASSIKSILRNQLLALNKADIITSSSDAPNGFVEKTFTVTISGNTATVNIEIKPCQSMDFILISFTLGDISQSA